MTGVMTAVMTWALIRHGLQFMDFVKSGLSDPF
jgi:hypothetical protein